MKVFKTVCSCFFVVFFPPLHAALVDKYGKLTLETCRHKMTAHECVHAEMSDRLEFMAWMHFCTTFRVTETADRQAFVSRVTTYLDGEAVANGERDRVE